MMRSFMCGDWPFLMSRSWPKCYRLTCAVSCKPSSAPEAGLLLSLTDKPQGPQRGRLLAEHHTALGVQLGGRGATQAVWCHNLFSRH
jgi:hypothetical protein